MFVVGFGFDFDVVDFDLMLDVFDLGDFDLCYVIDVCFVERGLGMVLVLFIFG